MKLVILDRATLGFDVDVSIFEKFGEVISYDVTKENETLERVKDADIVITNKVVINKEHMDNSKMKLVCITATGTNNVDLVYAKEKNIAVKNTKYLLTLSDGSTLEGITDDKGYTETALSSKQLNINSIEFIEDEN